MTVPPPLARAVTAWAAGRSAVARLPRGRRGLVYVLAAAAATITALTTVTVAVAVLASPALVPIAVAAKVLGPAAELFTGAGGDADGLEQAAREADVDCDAAPPAYTPPPPTAAPAPSEDVTTASPPEGAAVPPAAVVPIALGKGGAISREDAQALINPLPASVSALKAHVWFLYRLAGLGDWDSFEAAYSAAGLRDDDTAVDAPLAQVQTLNTRGAEVGRYRLTAAALTAAGQQTGRLTDPYPGYRDTVAVELVGSCQADQAVAGLRQPLPPPPGR